MRVRLRCPTAVKALFHAIVVALLLVCVLELGLRVYDSHRRQQLLESRRGEGLVVPSWTVHHELKPLRSVRIAHPDDPAVEIDVRTNSFGLRGPEPVTPKPAGVLRILVLGDEVVFGPDVAEEHTLAARLRELLAARSPIDVDVVNAGVPGDCPLLSYLRFRHSLAALEPDVVVAVFDPGDVADDHRIRRHTETTPTGLPIATPNMDLVRREGEEGTAEPQWLLLPAFCRQQLGEMIVDPEDGVGATDADSPQGRYAWLRDSAEWDVYVEQSFSAFELLRAACAASGARLVVATHPAPWQVSEEAGSASLRTSHGIGEREVLRDRRPFDRLGQYLAERRIPFCDASEAFRQAQRPETLYLANVPRLTEAGHDLYARVVATYLVERTDGPWR